MREGVFIIRDDERNKEEKFTLILQNIGLT
jgi:hypothetical protein